MAPSTAVQYRAQVYTEGHPLVVKLVRQTGRCTVWNSQDKSTQRVSNWWPWYSYSLILNNLSVIRVWQTFIRISQFSTCCSPDGLNIAEHLVSQQLAVERPERWGSTAVSGTPDCTSQCLNPDSTPQPLTPEVIAVNDLRIPPPPQPSTGKYLHHGQAVTVQPIQVNSASHSVDCSLTCQKLVCQHCDSKVLHSS